MHVIELTRQQLERCQMEIMNYEQGKRLALLRTPTSVSIGGTQTNLGNALRAWQTANSIYTAWNTGNVPTLQ